jgi:hypothetical protein
MMKIKIYHALRLTVGVLCLGLVGFWAFNQTKAWREKETLKQIIRRLETDSRIAQVLVTEVRPVAATGKTWTTIKFLEYDVSGKPLAPRYFTFSGNIIQFQSLVVRFEDFYVERGDAIRGKSAYLFLKIFFLDGASTEVYSVTPAHRVPEGYGLEKAEAVSLETERRFWQKFWQYALNPEEAKKVGIKNAQIEAPGTKFVPGTLYTIKIEHDGGMRIDAEPLPEILKGERILF